ANVSGDSAVPGVSSIAEGMTVNGMPRIESNSFRRGDAEARTRSGLRMISINPSPSGRGSGEGRIGAVISTLTRRFAPSLSQWERDNLEHVLNQESLPHSFHRPRIVSPVEFQLIRQGSRQTIEIRKQRRLRDIHSIQFPHALLPDLVRRQNKLDQRLLRIRISH